MAVPTTPSCTSVLNQQQEEVIYHHQQCSNVTINPCKNKTGMQTIVENGRVVVKPIAPAAPEKE